MKKAQNEKIVAEQEVFFKKVKISTRFKLAMALIIINFLAISLSFYYFHEQTNSYQNMELKNSTHLKKDIGMITEENTQSLTIFNLMKESSAVINQYYSDLANLRTISDEISMLTYKAREMRKIERFAKELQKWSECPTAKNEHIEGFAQQLKIQAVVFGNDPNSFTAADVQKTIKDITSKVIGRALAFNNEFVEQMDVVDKKLQNINKQLAENGADIISADGAREKAMRDGKYIVQIVAISFVFMALLIIVMIIVIQTFSRDIEKIRTHIESVVQKNGELDFSRQIPSQKMRSTLSPDRSMSFLIRSKVP